MNRITGTLAVLGVAGLIAGPAMADSHKDEMDLATEGARDMQKAVVNGKAHQQTIPMHALTKEGTGKQVGTITAYRTTFGVLFEPDLSGLSPGIHGFHLHENGDCGPTEKDGKVTPGGAAGGHYNPHGGSHNGPYERGHLGDLPALYATDDGKVHVPVLAPRLEFSDLEGRALIIHEGGDNYSDEPKALGGGGARVACGVIDKG